MPSEPNRPTPPGSGVIRSSLREAPQVAGLALPIVVGLAAATLVGVIDTIMIAPLGTRALAAAALTTSVLIVMFSAVYGLISVIGITMAQAEGAADGKGLSSALRNGTMLSGLAGVVAMLAMIAAYPLLPLLGQPEDVLAILLPYWIAMSLSLLPFSVLYVFKGLFDATGRPWTGAAIAMVGAVANVPLNYLFIYGALGFPGLGLVGAGIASVLAETLALTIAWGFWRRSRAMADYRQPTRVTLSGMRALFREGWPVAVAYTGEGGSYALVGLMMGWFGAAALAANQVVGSIADVLYMLPLGMAAAVGIRIGQAVGAGDQHRLRPIGLSAIGLVLVWMTAVTLALLFLRGDIAEALSDDPEVVSLAVVMFLTVAFMQFADGVQSSSLGALRGMMDNRVPTLITLVTFWGLALPAAYVTGFTLGFGPNGVWIGYGAGILVAALALVVRFWIRTATPGS